MFTKLKQKMFGRTIQEVFDVVIKEGYYSKNYTKSIFMCIALASAYNNKVITLVEYKKCKKAISRYLGNSILLKNKLTKNGLPFNFDDTLKIYLDWGNRPKLK